MRRLGWQAAIALGLSLALTAVLGYAMASGPSGEFGNLGVAYFGLFLIATTVVLAVIASLLFLGRRQLQGPLLIFAFAAGLFPGFLVGVRVYEAVCCLNVEPDPVRTFAVELTMRLGAPYSIELNGTGECTFDTSADNPPLGLFGTVTNADSGLEVELFGLPTEELNPSAFDSFDVIFFDGQPPAWGYRPTNVAQVQVERTGRLQGTTRLVDLPLLEDTRPRSSAHALVAETIDADIHWECDPDTPL